MTTKPLSKKALKDQERQEAITTLLTLLKPNDVVYTDIKSVSASGMSRQIACFIPYLNNENKPRIRDITWFVSKACDLKIGSKGGLIVGGCGMDMAFSVVYNLGCTLWPNGTPEQYDHHNKKSDSYGGYALKKEAL